MFKDKVYDDMDDVSKMFEPFQYNLNDELAKFPDRVEIKPIDLMSYDNWSGYGTDLPGEIRRIAKSLDLNQIIEHTSLLNSHGFFKFEVETDEEDDQADIWVDAGDMTMSHKIFLVKDKIAFDEKQLEAMRKDYTLGQLRREFNSNRDMDKARFNEIADIYGAILVKPERSYHGKLKMFCKHLEHMIDEKVLDIRDMELVHKFVMWIAYYVKQGNLAALNNLTRIKIITHEKRPIYSIEEKAVV